MLWEVFNSFFINVFIVRAIRFKKMLKLGSTSLYSSGDMTSFGTFYTKMGLVDFIL